MTGKYRTLFISISLMLIIFTAGCGKTANQGPGSSGNTNAPTTTSSTGNTSISPNTKGNGIQMKTFTKEELKKYDGQNGNPAYVAVDGVVYDVTNEKSWKGGKHKGVKAGNDVSEAMKSSSHGLEPLKKLPVVGKFAG